MNVSPFFRRARLALLAILPSLLFAQSTGTALVRHAPSISGTVDGSVQQMSPESVSLSGGSVMTGDLFVPGVPAVQASGSSNYGGTLDGLGGATPTSYTITLNGNATLRHVIRRTDPIPLPAVSAPPAPAGSRSVTLTTAGQTAGDFATIRNLTIRGGLGQIAVPAGTYGDFVAEGNSEFIIGTAGAAQPALYNFQRLALNGSGALRVVGPVIVTIGNSLVAYSSMGAPSSPAWLTLKLATGDFTLNGSTFSGYVIAPAGTVTLNGNSRIIGGLACDRLIVNGSSVVRLLAPAAVNQPPKVALTAPANGAAFAAPAAITLTAVATDSDGSVAKVEFFNGVSKLGERLAPDVPGGNAYSFGTTLTAGGTYTLQAKSTDNLGAASSSDAVTITVNVSTNQPPMVALTAPVDGSVYDAPGTITLSANATDPDGAIVKVEFYRGTQLPVRLGEATAAPFEFVWSNIPPGSYTLSAKAYDNGGATTVSGPRTITVRVGVPYFTGFEPTDGYVVGPLSAQAGWVATSGAVISDALSYRGVQSLLLAAGTTLAQATHAFPPVSGQSVAFVDWFARPFAGSTPDAAVFAQTESARVALVQSGAEGELQVFNGNGAGGGAWKSTGFKTALATDGRTAEWIRITLREDFVTKKWDIYGNGRLAAYDAGFGNGTTTSFSQFAVFGSATVTTAIDDFFAGFEHPLFANESKDGIDDAWKARYGLPLQNIRYLDPSNKGIPLIQSYMLGLNPNVADTSGDGLPDAWEIRYGLDPLANNASGDLVGDGVSNLTKYLLGRNPTVPAITDTTGVISLKVYRPR